MGCRISKPARRADVAHSVAVQYVQKTSTHATACVTWSCTWTAMAFGKLLMNSAAAAIAGAHFVSDYYVDEKCRVLLQIDCYISTNKRIEN